MNLDDEKIVELYYGRSETAISETEARFGGYLLSIAKGITGSQEDAEECVNDTYLRAWNSMPINRPQVLPTFLGKIVRNISIDRFRRKNRRTKTPFPPFLTALRGNCTILARKNRRAATRKTLWHFPQRKPRIFVAKDASMVYNMRIYKPKTREDDNHG